MDGLSSFLPGASFGSVTDFSSLSSSSAGSTGPQQAVDTTQPPSLPPAPSQQAKPKPKPAPAGHRGSAQKPIVIQEDHVRDPLQCAQAELPMRNPWCPAQDLHQQHRPVEFSFTAKLAGTLHHHLLPFLLSPTLLETMAQEAAVRDKVNHWLNQQDGCLDPVGAEGLRTEGINPKHRLPIPPASLPAAMEEDPEGRRSLIRPSLSLPPPATSAFAYVA